MKKYFPFVLGMLFCLPVFSQSVLTPLKEWSTTAGTQYFFHENVTVTDALKNVYVAGATVTASGTHDILIAKYNSLGVQQWIQQYNGLANSNDFATALEVDGSGNVYVTGAVTNDTAFLLSDLILIKYNSSGVQQWVQTYNGTGSAYDCGTDIFIKTGLNAGVYVVGGEPEHQLEYGFCYD
jgi:hypothetical protein